LEFIDDSTSISSSHPRLICLISNAKDQHYPLTSRPPLFLALSGCQHLLSTLPNYWQIAKRLGRRVWHWFGSCPRSIRTTAAESRSSCLTEENGGLVRNMHFSKGMMPTLIENRERGSMPRRTREQAAQLLEELRAQYQMLAPELRTAVKTHLLKISRLAESRKES
jgi:hypothetical protein